MESSSTVADAAVILRRITPIGRENRGSSISSVLSGKRPYLLTQRPVIGEEGYASLHSCQIWWVCE